MVTSDLRDNDKVLTEAELRAAVDLLLVSASATGSLSLDDYNKVNISARDLATSDLTSSQFEQELLCSVKLKLIINCILG